VRLEIAKRPTAPVLEAPVSLQITQTGGDTFNLSANVSSDGSATAVTKELAVTIENEDNKDATVKILLYNPKTDKEGLPDDLENKYFIVYYEIGSTKHYLYNEELSDEGYLDTPPILLTKNSAMEITIGVELKDAPAGIFKDNASYTMHIYFYQPNADYYDVVTYTITT